MLRVLPEIASAVALSRARHARYEVPAAREAAAGTSQLKSCRTSYAKLVRRDFRRIRPDRRQLGRCVSVSAQGRPGGATARAISGARVKTRGCVVGQRAAVEVSSQLESCSTGCAKLAGRFSRCHCKVSTSKPHVDWPALLLILARSVGIYSEGSEGWMPDRS